MKATINKLLRKFGAEIHGTGYLQALSKNDFQKDSFDTQYELLNKNAKIIFDVGANRGDVTAKYSAMFPGVNIYAFEPFAETFAILNQRFADNTNITCYDMAVAADNNFREFYVNRNVDTNSLYKPNSIGISSDKQVENLSVIQVKCTSLDEFCEKNNIDSIDILKMDIQGGELDALKGAHKLLSEKKIKLIYSEVFFVEQYLHQPLFHNICELLKQYGYYLQDFYSPFYGNGNIVWADVIFKK